MKTNKSSVVAGVLATAFVGSALADGVNPFVDQFQGPAINQELVNSGVSAEVVTGSVDLQGRSYFTPTALAVGIQETVEVTAPQPQPQPQQACCYYPTTPQLPSVLVNQSVRGSSIEASVRTEEITTDGYNLVQTINPTASAAGIVGSVKIDTTPVAPPTPAGP